MNDAAALNSLDRKLELVNDRVRAVVHGYQTGLFLCGAAGLGKSYNVLHQLATMEADFRVFNSRMTGKGLFRALEHAPEAVHLLEDMERLTHDRDAQGVLRSALWSQPMREREVTWTTATEGEARFVFRGGIIMLSNRPLADLPELRALATRIAVHKLEITDAEMAAHMRRIAAGGLKRGRHSISPELCLKVCDYLIDECKKTSCPLDLRLLDNASLDYLQWESNNSSCHWQDLVANRVRQSVTHFRQEVALRSKEARMEEEREIVRAICTEVEDAEERVERWQDETGKSAASFYRRKREVDSGEFDV